MKRILSGRTSRGLAGVVFWAITAGAGGVVLAAAPAGAGIPDPSMSFYVPQAGPVTTPVEGAEATSLFRACPNNDGDSSLPDNARIKVVVRDVNGNGVADLSAADICVLFNGGTQAQGFPGIGADSVVANSVWNQAPLCPDVRCIAADAPTDASGVTYITFAGATPGSPGVATRDPNRKWGHYDSELPVLVLGYKISGRLTSASANGTYVLRIKNFDYVGGLGAVLNQGEAVNALDFNGVASSLGVNNALSYWKDFDGDGEVGVADLNMIIWHLFHNCGTPNSP